MNRLSNKLWISLSTALFAFQLCSSELLAQPNAKKDTIADYEIPYIVGEAQELTVRLIGDLNSLHANIPEDAKSTVYNYIYDAFEEKENARVISDMDYSRPLSYLQNRNPISISKYALNYEVDPSINQILIPVESFKFTFPENTGYHQYELYGAYEQYFVNVEGDTLKTEPFIKLASFVATRDSITQRFDLKMRSVVFLDTERQPDFMLKEELAVLSQKYFEWKKSGSSMDNMEMMSDEAFQETLRRAKEKRDSKEALLFSILEKYDMAKMRHDVVGSAEEFAKAEKLQRNNPILLEYKASLSEDLTKKIEENYERAANAFITWNYDEASKIAAENEKAIGFWTDLNSRKYDNSRQIKDQQTEIIEAQNSWNDSQRKVDNELFRQHFKDELLRDVNSVTCTSSDKNEDLAKKYYFLGQIALVQNEPGLNYFQKAIDCRSEFALPKLKLIESGTGGGDVVLGYLADLIYFEPKNPNYFVMRSGQYLKNNEADKAEKDILEALSYDPNNQKALLRLAEIQIRNQAYTLALRNLDNLLYLDSLPQASILAAYASLERNGENNPDARKYVKNYSNKSLDNTSKNMLDSLITLYQGRAIHNRNTTMLDYEAAKSYEKMFVMAGHIPEYYAEWGMAARCYYDMGNEKNNFDRALVFANAAINQSGEKSTNGYLVKGLVSRAQHNYGESKESLYSLLKIQDNYNANYELGETFYAEDREIVSARIYYENALERLGKRKDKEMIYSVNKRIGQCFRKEGKYKLSEDQLKKAIRVYPKKGEGYYEMGLTYLANPKKVKQSFKYFDEALSKGYDDYAVFSSTALAYYKLEDYKKAKKEFQQLRFKYEKSISEEDLLNEARTFIALNELKEASSNLNLVVSRNNEFVGTSEHNYLQGLINLKKARETGMSSGVIESTLTNAKSNFEEAVKLDITNPDPYFGLSMAEFNLNHKESSLANLTKAISLRVDYEQFENEPRFKNYFKSKDVQKKLKAYKKQK
ncbi:hypothetical protein G3O08_08560 [Cryomorpha ignava]|uniref:Tetratricopeptide repeat protein n=1 Tax=Cryomorpha ignava TaxID=101383 RepID=A0A7K3WR80_9FLAO|nr:hypothetical protein [Cryomorpha ignava]NEN23551.1 hypothetical protein [Cryomorpha ignava]